ncbi:MAG: nedA 1 [Pedosphaera sp.]|nr:nedA 1 [Pedosphaera sp.]
MLLPFKMQASLPASTRHNGPLFRRILSYSVPVLACFYFFHPAALAASPVSPLPLTDVFANVTDGYPFFRIPAIIKTHKGTLLAFAEARAKKADGSENKIVLKRSLDSGTTWEKLQLVWDDGANSLNNPTVVLDNNAGRILLMFQRYPKGAYEYQVIPGLDGDLICRSFITRSDDDGLTWAKPVDITASVKRPQVVTSIASGPGIGIQLARGPHAGRLLIPFNQGPIATGKVYAVYSDDRGETWKYGEVAPGESEGSANEVQMVELNNGSVMLNARNQHGPHMRKTALSHDGGETWTTLKDDPQLIEPTCQASLIRFPGTGSPANDVLLFSNPASTTARTNGTIRLSHDQGKTWPISRVIYPEKFGYSCLVPLEDKTIGCLFERGNKISFCRFSLERLMEKEETGSK